MANREKYRVCFVTIGLEFSGAETVLWTYLEKDPLIAPFIITLFSGNGTESFKKLLGEELVDCLDLKYSKNELRFFPVITQHRVYRKMNGILQDLQPDVLYINNTLEIGLMKAVVKKTKFPTIGHVHDMRGSIKTFAKRAEISACFRLLDEIITVSGSCKESWGCEKMQVIYNGVPDLFYRKDDRDFSSVERTIGFVGKTSKRKGFNLLFKVIQKTGDDINWHIAYKDDDSCKRLLDRLKQRDNVQLFRDIPSHSMKDFYEGLSILVVPSREDPLPTVILEAMAANVLVIGSDVGGIPELIVDHDLIFETDSVDAIIKKIRYCFSMDSKKRKRYLERQAEHIKDHFSLESKRKNIDKLIQNLVEKGIRSGFTRSDMVIYPRR